MSVNKYGQNIPLTEEEKAIIGFKRRRLILYIIIGLLLVVIGVQIAVLLT